MLIRCSHVFRELSKFIASGRLHCRIDKVGGVVETNRPDSKNFLYQVSNQLLLDVQPFVYNFDFSVDHQAR